MVSKPAVLVKRKRGSYFGAFYAVSLYILKKTTPVFFPACTRLSRLV